jgi:hypothetical protein
VEALAEASFEGGPEGLGSVWESGLAVLWRLAAVAGSVGGPQTKIF